MKDKLHNVGKKRQKGKEKKIMNNVTEVDALRSRLGGKYWKRAGKDRTWLDR